MFSFDSVYQCPKGPRSGILTTPHGSIETPAFIFCATKASLKGLSIDVVTHAKTSIILSNTYHLMVQPGADVVARMGGLHKFMGWNGPMLTDSGGFQIFSLGHGGVMDEVKGKKRASNTRLPFKISEDGVVFQSYRNGEKISLTPESSLWVQHQLGADLVVVLDECTPFNISREATLASMQRSHRWAKRSLQAFTLFNREEKQRLYGIVQGGVDERLRKESCQFVESLPFFGTAIGGSLGQNRDQMQEVVSYTCAQLSPERPRHLLGIGTPPDIFWGVSQGIDTFDCVYPTRLARHGGALITPSYWHDAKEPFIGGRFSINLSKSIFREDTRPIDVSCPCPTCNLYSRGYLHHLIKSGEILAGTALTVHNITFMNRLMHAIRQGVQHNTLPAVQQAWLCH